MKHGGLGVLSFGTCAPPAFQAAADSADLVSAPLLDLDNQEATETKSQRERCQAALLTQREALFESLSRSEQISILEGASKLGRKWLSIIPFNFQLRPSDSELSAALHLRNLVPERHTHCQHCGSPSSFNHAEICQQRHPWTLWRHEVVKNAIGHALGSLEVITTRLEPPTHGITRRNDISIVSRSGPIRSEESDVTIVSLASQAASAAVYLPSLHRTLLPFSSPPNSPTNTWLQLPRINDAGSQLWMPLRPAAFGKVSRVEGILLT